MQFFSADATMFLKKTLNIFFAHEDMKKRSQKLFIIGPNFFFSIANPPKTSPNNIFCSIKMSPCVTSI